MGKTNRQQVSEEKVKNKRRRQKHVPMDEREIFELHGDDYLLKLQEFAQNLKEEGLSKVEIIRRLQERDEYHELSIAELTSLDIYMDYIFGILRSLD